MPLPIGRRSKSLSDASHIAPQALPLTCSKKKTDVRLIQVLLGHAKVDTTALYAQVATNVIHTVMSPLDRLTPLTPQSKPPA